ncbi:SDR family oxidoreductase [Ruegeria halocynthiae]|uniref:SDR family oxidoreductase n=2 Tax=Ruegeria halocynthiae TaxID=985054 RepID=UPI00056560D0|nr:SDR family oxidoreductase [Ruegeria halocynthiae]
MAGLCEGRVVLITGAGRGIGRGYALLLAAEGAKVIVNDLGAERDGAGADIGPAQEVVNEITAAGGEAIVNGADVSDFDAASGMIDACIAEYGRLDAVINNAGILRDRTVANMTEGEWDSVIKVHLKGTFNVSHHAARYWRDQSKQGNAVDARIINTASVSGLYGQIGQANYGAAKAGIATFTIISSAELERYGVTVNAVAPLAHTRMTEDLATYTDEDRAKEAPERVAPIVTWLVSEQSRHVTGRVFESGGGMLAVAESWQRGPTVMDGDVDLNDPSGLGPIVDDLLATAKPNAIGKV